MAKSVRLVSFITYLMITMLISPAVNSPPYSWDLPPVPLCNPVRSKTATSTTCKKQTDDPLCHKHCHKIERYLYGKCITSPKGKYCGCFVIRCAGSRAGPEF